jgi:hypothetical protein
MIGLFFNNMGHAAGGGNLDDDYIGVPSEDVFFSQSYHQNGLDVNQPFRADSWEGYGSEDEYYED